MTTRLWFLFLLLFALSGCTSAGGTLGIGDDDDSAPDDDDDSAPDDDDDDDDDATSWEGIYDGELIMFIKDEDFDSECWGDVRLEVDGDGVLLGGGVCLLFDFLEIEHEFTGVVTTGGAIEGLVTVSRGEGGPGGGGGGEDSVYEFKGDAGDDLELWWFGEWEFGGGGGGPGGGGGGSVEIFGEVYAWPQE